MPLFVDKNGQGMVTPNHLYDTVANVVTHPLQRSGHVATAGFHAPTTQKTFRPQLPEVQGLTGTKTHTSAD